MKLVRLLYVQLTFAYHLMLGELKMFIKKKKKQSQP